MIPKKLNISQIVLQHESQLRAFIRKRVSSAEDAEDILQEVFYSLAKINDMMNPIEQITAWLYRVTRNQIIDWQRKKKEEFFSGYENDEGDFILNDLAEILSDSSNPETEYLRSLVWEELNKSLQELPEEQRLVFEFTELHGLSIKEVSAQTGVNVNTLLSRKRYAVLYLRERMKKLYCEILEI